MTDEKKDRDASRAIFGGIGDEDSQQTERMVTPLSGGGSGSAEDGGGFGGPNSKSMLILVIVLAVLTVGSLVFGFTTFRSLNNSQAAYEDQINLLTRRLDSSDQVYADLKGQFQVSSDKLGLTQRDLARARRLANNIQKEQKVAVTQLSDAIEMKASTEELNRLQEESAARFSNLSSSITGTQRDLDATKEALAGTRDELGGLIAGNREELMALARRTDRDYFEFALAKKGLPAEDRQRNDRASQGGQQTESLHRPPRLRRQVDGETQQVDQRAGLLLSGRRAATVGVGHQ